MPIQILKRTVINMSVVNVSSIFNNAVIMQFRKDDQKVTHYANNADIDSMFNFVEVITGGIPDIGQYISSITIKLKGGEKSICPVR
jgi:hypothetical protein